MSDMLVLAVSTTAFVAGLVCLARLALGPADLAALYRAPDGDAWPPGTQEEDCPRWRLDGDTRAEPTATASLRPRAIATAELVPGPASELADLDPAAGRPAGDQLALLRVAVHGRVGPAGRAGA